MSHVLGAIFEPGFFESSAVGTAVAIGALAAVVAGAVGVFAVMRAQSFAGEALGDIGAAGGSGAFLVGVGPLWGFLVAGVAAAGAMELIGVQRPRGRDLATGIVLGAGLGLAALFLYLNTTVDNTSGAVVTVLFGSIFAVPGSTIPLVVGLAAVALALLGLVYRPLLLSSVNAEIAASRGVPVRLVGAVFLLALAVCVALCALTIGSILATGLLIGPAAASLRLTRRPGRAILTACGLGVVAMWLGIVLAYDSYYWTPRGTTWPVSFFVVTIVFVMYLLSGVPACWAARRI